MKYQYWIGALIALFSSPCYAEVIGSYNYAGHTRNVVKILPWQSDIYKELGIPFQTQLYLRTLNTAECGDQDGFCITPSDAGPFQVNQIHGKYHKWSRDLAKKGQNERSCVMGEKVKGYVCKSKKGDWSEVIEIRNELFKNQAKWTWERMKNQVSRFKLPEDRKMRMGKIAKLHNGGPFMKDYEKRAKLSYSILVSYYDTRGKKEGGENSVVRQGATSPKQATTGTVPKPATTKRKPIARTESEKLTKFLNTKF